MLNRIAIVCGLAFLQPAVGTAADPAGVVRPAAKPAKITPTKADDKAEIKLPGTVDATCFGGGGRFVLLRIPKVKQVAILDVCEGKIVKFLPLAEEAALIAATNEHLFVLNPVANVLQRWNLTTFEKELTVANPLEGTCRALLAGHATDGPIFLVGPNSLLDAKTLKEVKPPAGEKKGSFNSMRGHPQYAPTVRLSADGRVYAWYTQGLSPSGLSSLVLGNEELKGYSEHTTVGAILPGPDGTLFTAAGLYTPELKPIGDKKPAYQYWYHAPIPAAHSNWYISIASADLPGGAGRGKEAGPKVSLKMVGEDKAIVPLGDLEGFDIGKDHNQTAARGLQLHDRVFLVPDAKAMAVLNGTADKVYIHKVDQEALLEKAGIDYLFVVSSPGAAVRGSTFKYKPEIKSRKGGAKVKLDAGPDGMKVGGDGTVSWAVPKNFADASVSVILTISDKSGQETFHTFTLPVNAAVKK